MSQPKIIVVGSSNVDMIIKGERIPRPGETVIGGEFHKAGGGKGANQAIAAARAGGKVTFVSSVGDDLFGHEAIAGFQKDGIVTDYVKIDPEHASGIALILVDANGENSISVASGANASLSPADLDKASSEINGADIVLMQLETPLATIEAAAERARKAGVKVILNPAPAQELSDDLLRSIDILTPNETEAELLSGVKITNDEDIKTAASRLLEKGVETVIVTLGKQGVLLHTPSESKMIPGFSVDAIDTTAAGDTFNGALAVAIAEGKELEEAIRFANAAGAIAVTRLGAQASAPKRKEIEQLMERKDPD